MKKNFQSKQAFVLLYAVLVASVVLAIGFSLANIITKQIVLSSIGKSSRVAYYAADGGRECGLFWATYSKNLFSKGTDLAYSATSIPLIRCQDGANFSPSLISSPTITTTPEINLLKLYPNLNLLAGGYNFKVYHFPDLDFVVDNQKACAKVTLFVFSSANTKKPNYRNVVLSRGFNTACGTMVGPRTVSRTVINTSTW
jgi:hypothetical protein